MKFLLLGNLIIKFHLRNKKSITFFVTFTLLQFDIEVCLPLNKRNELNLSQTAKSKPEKSKKKNHQDIYKSLHYVHRLKTKRQK